MRGYYSISNGTNSPHPSYRSLNVIFDCPLPEGEGAGERLISCLSLALWEREVKDYQPGTKTWVRAVNINIEAWHLLIPLDTY
jgi:hypothetical protein